MARTACSGLQQQPRRRLSCRAAWLLRATPAIIAIQIELDLNLTGGVRSEFSSGFRFVFDVTIGVKPIQTLFIAVRIA